MKLATDAFGHQQPIPVKYTKDGENISPPLRWSDLPKQTRELALVFENITPETQEPFVQWLICKIAPELDGLPEGFQHKAAPEAPAEVLQGINSIGNVGYDGPLGTVGRTIHYRFHLYALDRPLDVPGKLDKPTLLEAMSGHVLEEAALDATYERSP